MKRKTFVFGFFALLCGALLFLACPTEPGDDGEAKEFSVSVTASTGSDENKGPKYYSLRTGEAVQVTPDSTTSTDWDIAFSRTRLILTNSGATNSSGLGAVWYAGTTDFDHASLANVGADTVLHAVDTPLYAWTGMGAGPSATTSLNVMTFVGYAYGTGLTNTVPTLQGTPPYDPERDGDYPANGALTSYEYNADQYYYDTGHGSGGPSFDVTNKVYIIRHGDGSGYSKIQVVEYGYGGSPTADNFVVKYKKL
jgi:hypothetical protein